MGNAKQETGPTNYVGTIKVTVRGREYYTHILPPPPATTMDELRAGLIRNREILKSCQERMREAFEMEAFQYAAPWMLNYDAPTQDAIMAHLNINALVPLINLKGGSANFEKTETVPVQLRLEAMRNAAERSVFFDHLGRNNVNAGALLTVVLLVFLTLIFS